MGEVVEEHVAVALDPTPKAPAAKGRGRHKGSKNRTTRPPKPTPAKKQKTCWTDSETEHLIIQMNDVKVKSRILGTAVKNEGVYEDVTAAMNDKFPPRARRPAGR